jgi:hypothetical protein
MPRPRVSQLYTDENFRSFDTHSQHYENRQGLELDAELKVIAVECDIEAGLIVPPPKLLDADREVTSTLKQTHPSGARHPSAPATNIGYSRSLRTWSK